MLRKPVLVFSFLLVAFFSFAQLAKPKLVVGLIIDQMRWDYLYRYNNLYTANGFKRLLKEGFSAENTLIPYMPTYTAPGHTCIYTGSVPAVHGIVGNNWYDKAEGKFVYCTDDSTVNTVGSNSKMGKMSPVNLWATTITDELRLSNNFKSKVIGIALKDRGAILPAGHSANAAYWYDAGKWITSTYYMNNLPGWVNTFNDKDVPGNYMGRDWNTLLPLSKYDLSSADDKPYETNIKGEKGVVFPHKLSAIEAKDKYDAFKTTPYANTFTFDFAKATIENEALGKNTVTDFLTVSISSTDYIGHSFGPNSIEIEDTYLRLDNDIADFLIYLDTKFGKGNYTVFLSADHGVAHIPAFLKEHNIPGGTFEDGDIAKDLNKQIEEKFALKNAVKTVMNYQIYLDKKNISAQGKSFDEIKHFVIDALKEKDFIINAIELDEVMEAALPAPQRDMLMNGYNPKRSGDIQFTFKPGYFDGGNKGTTHGLWNPYDAHIPCIFFGWGVKPGKTNRETYMTDIAPTLAALMHIQMPSGCVGKVITEAIK
jgi:predicted AlkP superfamily pyrophosphatase or phosphodiesterase